MPSVLSSKARLRRAARKKAIATEIEITHGGHTRDNGAGGASVVAASKLTVLTRYTSAFQLELRLELRWLAG